MRLVRPVPPVTTALAAALIAMAATARAQPREITPENGRAIAERLCTNCHLTDSTSTRPVPAGAPTFSLMANKPSQTYERVVGMLLQPHAPMPDIQLTREEILNIVAYLDSLRHKELPPLRDDKDKGQQKLPPPNSKS